MAPTIVQNTSNEHQGNRPTKSTERRSDLLVRTKYTNTLPDIPFDTKFVKHPFDPNRFIEYKPTSLERSYKFEVLPEFDLGVPIDLINPDAYAHERVELSPADEALLEEEILVPKNVKRSQHHNQSVSWLRRTEYISTEQTRFQPSTMEKVEAKVGFSIKRNFKDETLYMDRSSQIKAIEKRFEDAKLPVTNHYSKPNVYAVEELPIFPDFKCWKYPCAQVIFDSDPAPVGRPIPAQIEEMSQAMIRGVMDESGEQFVAYFLPTAETLEKRREDMMQERTYDDDSVYEYSMAREYNWNVKSKTSAGYEENYFFVSRQDGIYYNELETRVRLSKRRQVSSQNALTKLVIQHRPLDEPEFNMLKVRERAVEDEYMEETEETKETKETTDDEIKNTETDEEIKNTETDDEIKNTETDDEIKNTETDDEIKNTETDDEIKNTETDDEIKNTETDEAEEEKENGNEENTEKPQQKGEEEEEADERENDDKEEEKRTDDVEKNNVETSQNDTTSNASDNAATTTDDDDDDDVVRIVEKNSDNNEQVETERKQSSALESQTNNSSAADECTTENGVNNEERTNEEPIIRRNSVPHSGSGSSSGSSSSGSNGSSSSSSSSGSDSSSSSSSSASSSSDEE